MSEFNNHVPVSIGEIEAHLALVEAGGLADRAEWDAAIDRLLAAIDELPHPAITEDLAVRAAEIAIEAHRPEIGRRLALLALDAASSTGDAPSVEALLALGHALSDLAEFETALELYEASRAWFVERDDLPGVAHVDMNVAIIDMEQGEYGDALVRLRWCASVFQAHEVWDELAACGVNLVAALRHADRLDEAAEVSADLIEYCRRSGDRLQLANALYNGANVDQDCGHIERARGAFIEAMEIYRKLNLPTEQADCLDALGVIGRLDGLYDYAAAMHSEAIRIYEGTHHDADQTIARHNLAVTRAAADPSAE